MQGYSYDYTQDQFIPDKGCKTDLPIKRDSSIRHKIETLKFDKNEFFALSTLNQNYLGVISS